MKEDAELKFVGRLILAAVFYVLTGLLMAVAAAVPNALFAFYESFDRSVLDAIASVTGEIPFCVWEAALLVLILVLVYSLVQAIRRVRILSWIAGVLVLTGVLAFSFTALWGINHFGAGIGEKLDLSVREYSVEELKEATGYYCRQVSLLADEVSRDENGCAEFEEFDALAKKADGGYRKLADNALFAGQCPAVKKLVAWPLFSRMGTTGVFVCFTAEPSVNPDTATVWLPVTMCHELAHSKLLAAEDDANFCAYLTCMANDDAQFRYSGALAAYVYCNNALHRADADAAKILWDSLDSRVRADIENANAHYAQYEGKIQDVASAANDAYLKAFSEKSGVRSYGEAANLLIAWYQRQADSTTSVKNQE